VRVIVPFAAGGPTERRSGSQSIAPAHLAAHAGKCIQGDRITFIRVQQGDDSKDCGNKSNDGQPFEPGNQLARSDKFGMWLGNPRAKR